MIELTPLFEGSAILVEAIGILIITVAAVYALFAVTLHALRRDLPESSFHHVRQRLGRGILLGLEFLVAADIIHTVAVELTFETVSVLAIIVLIRTFLSFTLEVEVTGRWPWQAPPAHRGASSPNR